MLLIFLAGILWGTIGIFEKTFVSLGSEGSLSIFLRMFFAFLITFSIAIFRNPKKLLSIFIDKNIFIACFLLGVISNGIFNIFYSNSIRLNGMAIAAVLMYTAPVFTSLASKILFHEKFSHYKILALIINILGCILTVTGGNIFNPEISIMGILCGIGSGFCYGMAPIFAKLGGEKSDSLILSVYSYFFAAIFLAVFVTPPIGILNVKFIVIGLLYGFIPTSLAYLVYYSGIKKINPDNMSKVPVIASIEPVTAIIIGNIFYAEKIGLVNLLGIILVMLGIILAIKK